MRLCWSGGLVVRQEVPPDECQPTPRRLISASCPLNNIILQVLAALGLRTAGLAAACTLPLVLTALLFAGPLLQLALSAAGSSSPTAPQRSELPLAAMLRNWLVAPLVEELVFRSCLISYLLAAGASTTSAIWLSPLLFGASHLHHLYDLTRHQGYPLSTVLQAMLFQLSYTTVFGWLAALFFVRSRHLAAAVLPHAFCNFMGPPAPPPPQWGALRRRAVVVAYAAGIAAFFWLVGPLTDPRLYSNVARHQAL